ncbi:PAS domain-containing protein [Sphingomonas sp. AP4-R1]|uniref:PAS domain-containing protein n=1 Tax=Sphingomonas sp. AP4-R1 TaxID=2735134 RepID=UPI0020A576C4|nr:PAS domain-containing protein [Sphingomonas sp. AP4-R1]
MRDGTGRRELDLPEVPSEIRVFFENSPVALGLASPVADHELVLVNKSFYTLTGYRPSDAIGRNCRFLQGEAENGSARATLRAFLADDAKPNVRTPIINFKEDGTPFVNLLYMSRLRSLSGNTRFIFASQFDVSRSHPDLLSAYDRDLGSTLIRLSPVIAESGLIVEGTLTTIANTANVIAQAKLTLADLDDASFL